MDKREFRELIKNGPLYLDGATGSCMQAAGMPVGACPEKWILDNEEKLISLQKKYVEAGTRILYAPTFGANRIKLADYGLAGQIKEMNEGLVAVTKKAAAGRAYVAGDITMTGRSLYPLGNMTLDELMDVYREQAQFIENAGADLFVVETMMSLAETRAALIAVKEVSDLPVMVTMTFEANGRSLYGTSAEAAVVVLQSLGADAVGANCSTGPKEMAEIIRRMKRYARVPLVAKPNAGLPKLINGESVYDMGAEEFASYGPELINAGAAVIGGCCGTDPDHIAALCAETRGMQVPFYDEYIPAIASERSVQEIVPGGPFTVIGERINPTGKKKLQEALRNNDMSLVETMAEEQEEAGAKILDVNVGMNGIDEKETLLAALETLGETTQLPLCIDTSDAEAMEAALLHYPGRALINSISCERSKIEKFLPLAKKYGAMFILLPLSDEGLPQSTDEKKEIIGRILEKAYDIGIEKEDIVIDGLAATVGAQERAAADLLDTIEYCTDTLKTATVCGLSNISFGLPKRPVINGAFAAMAIQRGLTMAILNPMSDQVMDLAFAADMLLAKKDGSLSYIDHIQKRYPDEKTVPAAKPAAEKKASAGAYECVLAGKKKDIVPELKKRVEEGALPEDLINNELIPAINEVGELFEKQKYFLPQLIASAETMKSGIEYLEPMIKREGNKEDQKTVIMATVEGDVHDIGKNLVVLMLRNYGYRVIDLGKDVKAEVIIDAAEKENADIIGLSALMTVTMVRMKEVIELAKERGVRSKIIIGGAVISQSYADEIGADGYSSDAADCVKLVKRLCG